jgi:hypothetical protein
MVATDPEGLAQTINEGIAVRGIYALIDERLDLLCGPGTIRRINSSDITPANQTTLLLGTAGQSLGAKLDSSFGQRARCQAASRLKSYS